MKSLIIFLSLISMLLCVESGFLNEIIGSVTNEVREITEGNTLNNVANKVIHETTDILKDLGGLLQIKKPTSDTKLDDIRNEENILKEVTNSFKEVENDVKEVETNLPLKEPQIDVRVKNLTLL